MPSPKMLVLSRKIGEKILIGDSISVTVVRISGGGVRIGIDAPADLSVVREELASDSSLKPVTDTPDSESTPVLNPNSQPRDYRPDSSTEPSNSPKKPR